MAVSEQTQPIQTPPENRPSFLSRLAFWRGWTTPRSTDRDEAFREFTIRSVILVLMILGSLSLVSAGLVFGFSSDPISYDSVTLAVLITIGIAGWAVSSQKITLAGQLLVLALGLGAAGVIVIDGYWSVIALPTFMLLTLITALVLPRSALLPTGIGTVLVFTAIALLQESSGRNPIPIDRNAPVEASNFIFNVTFLVLLEVAFLRQLRVEFDARLAAMSQSILEAQAAKTEADRANQAKSRFLASMSHEFRTPLNAIIGYVDILIAGMAGDLSDKQSQLQGHIKHNAKRLLAMINDTLDMAKIEAGRVEFNITDLSPKEVVEQTVGSMASLASQKNIHLAARYDTSTPTFVKCDEAKLQQIITNLIGNAIKFTKVGGVTVETGGTSDNRWYLRVTDTGVGMPEDAATYIFETFTQVKGDARKTAEGTGLGLAITKRYIDFMGGDISVVSAPNKGSTFTITLPCNVQAMIS